MHVPQDTFKAIGRLKSNADFAVFTRLLEEESRSATEAALSTGGEQVFRAQGRANALREILQTIESAASALPR